MLWLWCRLAPAALIGPLARELPYAASAAVKRKKKYVKIVSHLEKFVKIGQRAPVYLSQWPCCVLLVPVTSLRALGPARDSTEHLLVLLKALSIGNSSSFFFAFHGFEKSCVGQLFCGTFLNLCLPVVCVPLDQRYVFLAQQVS